MNMRPLLSVVFVAILSLAFGAFAADPEKSQDKKPKPKPVNATCPVSDDQADPNVTVTHKGKLIAFCCEDCAESFKKSPDKFMKKVEAEEAKNKKAAEKSKGEQPAAKKSNEPVNKFCPIDRENAVDPTVTTVHNGKVVGFCCEDCVKKFDLDPDTYMANLK